MSKRAFLIVMDSLGIGNAPDAKMFGDEGSDTLLSISKSDKFNMPNMQKMGFFNIDDISLESVEHPQGSFARIQEKSNGKDTTIGHWEIMGIESEKPLPTFPDGFPEDFLNEFSKKTGYKCICNKAYSGTEVLKDYAKQSVKDGALIVYTSADSVFQVAAHEEVISVEKLYNACEIARSMLTGSLAVGRVIARPFVGDEVKGYTRTARRHDFSILPPDKTLLDFLCKNGKKTIGVGKIYDIFAGQGIDETFKTANNSDGMQKTMEIAKTDFEGLCFVNLVDFDMVYGHRNDVDGYATAATAFDVQLAQLLPLLKNDDILMITADHGCDPATPSTDHSRECVPLVIYGDKIKKGVNLGTLTSYADIAATLADYFDINAEIKGKSFFDKIKNN